MAATQSGFRGYPWWVRTAVVATAAFLLLSAVGILYGLWRLGIDRPVAYQDDAEHFKHGSLGGERGYYWQVGFGLPYWIWVALPELFPEHLPDRTPGRGYAAFGYIYEPGSDPRFDLPVGLSRRNVMGIDRVWLNCGSCHTGTVRATPEGAPDIVVGMPANRYDQGAWARFLFDCAVDEKFTGHRLLLAIDGLQQERRRRIAAADLPRGEAPPRELSWIDRQAFKLLVVPIMRKRLLDLRDRLGFIRFETWGPGRVDTFNAPKALLNFPMAKALPEELLGNVDLPSVWHQEGRKGMQLHWDGNNTSVDERNLSAAFAATIPPVLDKCSLRRVARFLETAAPPPFPAERIDRALAARGAPLYGRYCAGCHGAKEPPFRRDGMGERVGSVVPLSEIGTDRWRLDSYTPMLARAQGSLYAGYPLPGSAACPGDPVSKDYPARFSHFRKTDGYANSPLDGLWLRAPYLHNGSVPTLAALLEPAAGRPRVFWTGYDVYDFAQVGFVTDGPEARARGWRYDTGKPGNGNRGHEGPAYGTDLPAPEKDALIEYLKTF